MATCPNINLESWKNLVAARGENIAYYLWDKYAGNVPEAESKSEVVKAGLKSINALQSDRAIQLFTSLEKNKVKGDAFWNKIQSDLQIPKEQIELLKQYNTTNREELITNMLADYSYAVEINTATTNVLKPAYLDRPEYEDTDSAAVEEFTLDGVFYRNHQMADYPTKGYDYERITDEEFKEAKNKFIKSGRNPTSYYSNLTVSGGTNYTENEIATPAITPSIKGHAQFATDKGIGWFRSDDRQILTEQELKEIEEEVGISRNKIPSYESAFKGKETKTRRILEVQSDIFQKSRDIKSAEDIYAEMKKSGELIVDCG